MATATASERDLAGSLRRAPDSVWIREGLVLCGWGEASRFDPGTGDERYERARQMANDAGTVAFASFTFDLDRPGSVVLIPETTLRIDDSTRAFIQGDGDNLPPSSSLEPIPTGRMMQAGGDEWGSSFERVMAAIRQGKAEKVVLSRVAEAMFDDQVPPLTVLNRLVASQPRGHTYLIDDLVGSSPELLIKLEAGSFTSVSLAGSADSRMPGSSESLTTSKMVSEHRFAADSVQSALVKHTTSLERKPSGVATFGDIQHLATAFSGTAAAGTSITDLLASLHPTAAVAGTPTEPAMELIRRTEHHDRGRYAGPIGWVDEDGDGEFAIALRCGLIAGRSVLLYCGAGLVAGSTADDEYAETEIKLRPMLNALGLGS